MVVVNTAHSFWRPVDDPVYNWPLVICDGRTVIKDKLVAVDQVSRQFVADVYYANYDPSYQWYYQSSMRPDEGVLFKSWDTAANVTAKSKFLLYFVICGGSNVSKLASIHPRRCQWSYYRRTIRPERAWNVGLWCSRRMRTEFD